MHEHERMVSMPILLPINEGEDKSSQIKNRIRNTYRHLKKWAKRTQTDCFRIYDSELAYYPLAIDYYAGRFCVHYFSKRRDEEEPPEALQEEITSLLCNLFAVPSTAIYWRTRIRRKREEQYEKRDTQEDFFTVFEYGLKFKINLVDYLDTGLFLDHRETRKMVGACSKGKKVLNLFAYTCSFSIHAAAGGALSTKSVDLSNTYTGWGKENFLLNHLSLQNNQIVREDCIKFLEEELTTTSRYDLIILDPPTISRSKKMEEMFDIQEEYVPLIRICLALLNPRGTIFFSTNSRKFLFDEKYFTGAIIQDISTKTLPADFSDPKIHRCWKITKH